MNVVKLAIGSAVVALVAGQQLSTLDATRRAALLHTALALTGGLPGNAPPVRRADAAASEPVAPVAFTSDLGAEILAPDRSGQFQTVVEVDGSRISTLVDTGATFMSLSAEDADRLGLHPMPSDFRYTVSTANGHAMVAQVRLPSVRLGSIVVRDVTALISGQGALNQSLLGMSFLSRLSTVRMDHGRMVLAP